MQSFLAPNCWHLASENLPAQWSMPPKSFSPTIKQKMKENAAAAQGEI